MSAVVPLFVLQKERKQGYKTRKLLEHLSEAEVKTHCGLPIWGVREIIEELEVLEGKNIGSIPLETRVLSFLTFMRSGSFQWALGSLAGYSQASASRIIRTSSLVLASKVNEYVSFPDLQHEYLKVIQGFYEINNFPGVIGAIDGTQVGIKAPSENENTYFCRKNFYSLNIQVIVDHQYQFTDAVIKWPGSTHDSFIWQNSGIREKLSNSNCAGHLIGNNVKY